jgi:hypothetical protein
VSVCVNRYVCVCVQVYVCACVRAHSGRVHCVHGSKPSGDPQIIMLFMFCLFSGMHRILLQAFASNSGPPTACGGHLFVMDPIGPWWPTQPKVATDLEPCNRCCDSNLADAGFVNVRYVSHGIDKLKPETHSMVHPSSADSSAAGMVYGFEFT